MIRPSNGIGRTPSEAKKQGSHLFLLASTEEADQIAAGLTQALGTKARVAAPNRIYMDTADGRLWARAMRLSTAREGRTTVVTWESDGATNRVLRLSSKPGLATDLPPGSFRDALAEIIAERRLLPVARVEAARPGVDVLDARGKTVVRVGFERWSQAGTSRAAKRRPMLVRVSAVRGFRKPFERVLRLIEQLGGLLPLDVGDAFDLLGLRQVTQKPTLRLARPMRADEAAKQLLLVQLEAMTANEKGTRKATDPEFLHEYRVAVRRTRVALSRLPGVFPARTTERFKREFRWLGSVTGPARDLDVYLLELPKYAACLTPEAAKHLAPLRPYLEERCRKAYAALGRAMQTERYRRLLRDWRGVLEHPSSSRVRLEAATQSVDTYADRIIWKMHRRVVKQGAAIEDATPDEAVHDLRLACKKLRYLMEFFRSLYPEREIKNQIKALKSLQEVLGEFNDLSVQQASLLNTANGMTRAGVAPLETVVALGRLVETLGTRQREARARFGPRFQAFAATDNRKRARHLFGPKPEGVPA